MKLQSRSEKEKGIIALILLAFIFGILPVMLRYLGTSFNIFQQIYIRFFLGVLFTWIIFRKQIRFRLLMQQSLKEYAWIFLRAALYFLFGVGLYNYAILLTKISNVVFIDAIPMTALFGFLLLHEKVTRLKIFCILLSLIGVLIISFKGFYGTMHFGWGELLTFMSSIFLTLGLLTRKMRKTKLNDFETGFLMLLFAAVQFLIVSLFAGEGVPLHGWTPWIVLLLVFGGFINTGITVLLNYGFARVDGVLGGNILSLQVVLAIFFAKLFFGEIPILKEVIGGAFVLAGSAILTNSYTKSK